MKKIILLLLISLIVFPLNSIWAKEKDNEPIIIVLGDSIATGYGLANYVTAPSPYSPESYVSILADRTGYTITNYAVDGMTSEKLKMEVDILAKQPDFALVDVVIISVGGNDLLRVLVELLGDSWNIPSNDLLTTIDITSITNTYLTNLLSIVATIKEANPNVRIIVQTIANPYAGISTIMPMFQSIEELAEEALVSLNSVITANANDNTYVVADIYTEFKQSSMSLNNATNPATFLDPHPNKKGHVLIADIVGQFIPYKITFNTFINGIITTDQLTAFPGETVQLTIVPNEGYKLKAKSLKMNNVVISGNSFVMPSENVTISASFEAKTNNMNIIIISLLLILASLGIFFIRYKKKHL